MTKERSERGEVEAERQGVGEPLKVSSLLYIWGGGDFSCMKAAVATRKLLTSVQ
jgi:hypothetical protein